MFREFNVKFEDVEMLGGADNLLEGTEITKVIVRGDNNKMSSLDSMLKNCNELDTVDGELDLNGVGDIDNLLEGTELVKSINLKNINNENISANNSFPHIEEINIGGELYNKKAMQNVIASKEWTFDNITYSGTVGDNVVTKETNINDNNKVTIQDTLEQKARGFEIIGQTYENLVVGSGEVALLDELTLESVDGSPNEFNPHIEQPVCVETIEGETYQNLIEGKGEYRLTDTFSTTWTESNNCIENASNIIEIPEIFGNTVQGFANCITTDQIVTSLVNTINTGATSYSKRYMPNNSGGYVKVSDATLSITDFSLLTDECFIQLKPNTTYSYRSMRVNSNQAPGMNLYSPSKSLGGIGSGNTFTTDNTGKVIMYPSGCQDGQIGMKLVEGEYNLNLYPYDYDLNVIQSVGDLYVNSKGEPILDEGGNEQYKLDIISHGYTTDETPARAIVQNVLLSSKGTFINITSSFGTPTRVYFQCIAKIDTTKAKTGWFCTFSQGAGIAIKYYSTDHSLKFHYNNVEYLLGSVNHNEPFSITIKQSNDDKIMNVYFNGTEVANIACETMGFSHSNFVAFNTPYHTGPGNNEGCNYINLIYVQGSKNSDVDEDDWNNINKWNKTTILMPQPLMCLRDNYDRIVHKDKLYWDYSKNKYLIEQNVGKIIIKSFGSKYGTFFQNPVLENPDSITVGKAYSNDHKPIIKKMRYVGWKGNPTDCDFGIGIYSDGSFRCYQKKDVDNATLEDLNNFIGEGLDMYLKLDNPKIIETKILEKPSLDTYSPKTYISTNAEIQPSQMSITNKRNLIDLKKMKANTDYTVQLKCNEKGNKPIKINLCGKEKDIDATIGGNHVNITTNELNDNKLELSGEGNIVSEIIVVEGEMNQYPKYFNGVQSTGELQDDGTYKIDIETSSEYKEVNIFNSDIYSMEDGTIDISSGINQNYANESRVAQFIPCVANTEYRVEIEISGGYGYICYYYDANKKYLGCNKEANSFYAITEDKFEQVAYVRFRVNKPVGSYNNVKLLGQENTTHKISIISNSPLAKGDKLYWNKSNKRYEIDRSGSIEVPTVEGDIIDLPRLYQREDTHFSTSTGNIKPSKIKIDYNDLD